MLLEPGRLIGAYEILAPLGRGGMGEVYRARHTRLGMLAAIKVVSAKLESDPAAAERLDREARLASSLNHPAIVTIHDIGEVEGRPFIVMEFVDGQPLSARLAAGPMKAREAVELACQVADGLAAAHGAGVVHRDLKPQNIMVTSDGRAKIVDFGLSKMAPVPAGPDVETAVQPGSLTAPHTVLGSAGYMAPEQVSGRPSTFRTDQFALGVVLYEMLTGHRTFTGDTAMDTLAAILKDEPTPIVDFCPTLSPRLVTIIERCLAKRPENRYGSTRDLARDLAEVRDQLTSSRWSLPPIPVPFRFPPWRGIAALLVVVLALAGVYYRWMRTTGPAVSHAVNYEQVAVLPFDCSAGDQVICDGLVEALTSGLTDLSAFNPKLRVVSQAIALRDMPPDKASPETARSTLGATVAIAGGMERRASGIRATVTAIDATNSTPSTWARFLTWWGSRSQTIDIAAGQEDKLQRALVMAAATLLHMKLTKEANAAIGAGGTAVPRAYVAYLQGRGSLRHLRPDDPGFAGLAAEARNALAASSIASLTTAVQADRNFALAHAALCEAYWRQYESTRSTPSVDLALASCRLAIQIDERLLPVRLTLVTIARGREGRHEEAIASARQAVALAPWSSAARGELAAAYQTAEQWDKAEATYEEALKELPDDPTIYGDLCRFYLLKRLYERSQPACRRAVELTPDNTRVLNNLGAALLGIQANEEAVAKFKHSLEVRPTSAAASGLGYYYYLQGNYADAARSYEEAVELLPESLPAANKIEVYRSLGASLYWTENERPKSRRAYETVVQLITTALADQPKNTKLLAKLADAYSLLDRVGEALAALGQLERLKLTDSEDLFLVAGAYEQSGHRTQALGWLQRAVAAGYSREKAARSPFLKAMTQDARYANAVK